MEKNVKLGKNDYRNCGSRHRTVDTYMYLKLSVSTELRGLQSTRRVVAVARGRSDIRHYVSDPRPKLSLSLSRVSTPTIVACTYTYYLPVHHSRTSPQIPLKNAEKIKGPITQIHWKCGRLAQHLTKPQKSNWLVSLSNAPVFLYFLLLTIFLVIGLANHMPKRWKKWTSEFNGGLLITFFWWVISIVYTHGNDESINHFFWAIMLNCGDLLDKIH